MKVYWSSVFLVCYIGLFLFSCKEDEIINLPELSALVIDSVCIISSDYVEFIDYDDNQFLFLEKSKNNLVLYDVEKETYEVFDDLKNTFPQFNSRIYGGVLYENNFMIFVGNSLLKFSIEENKILESHQYTFGRSNPAELIFEIEKDIIYSNLIPFTSLEGDEYYAHVVTEYDNKGEFKHYFSDRVVPIVTDIKFFLDLEPANEELWEYIFPFNKIYHYKMGDSANMIDHDIIEFEPSFLSQHPYYIKEKYDIGDLPYIPIGYSFHKTDDFFLIQIFEGGNKEMDIKVHEIKLAVLNKTGKLMNYVSLPNGLGQLLYELPDGKFIFSSNPGIEKTASTCFYIVDIKL